MIDIIDVSKKFDDKYIYKDFSLKIETGEFVILNGESGCGKTTLLNMIGSIEPVDSGQILVDGTDITLKKNQLNYLRQGVGFLFQNFALIENKTVIENLKIVKENCRSQISFDDALERVGLTDKKDTKVYKLSGGEQQRVGIARLLIKKSSLILADEPTGSLDKRNGKVIMDLLKSLQADGKTIVMVSHDLSLSDYGSRTINLQKIE